MARTVNYPKRAEKIKEMIDDSCVDVRGLTYDRDGVVDGYDYDDFENIDVVTLMQVQARISRLILEKSK